MKNELSKKNSYWLPKERYLELVHFSRGYKSLVEKLYDIWGVGSTSIVNCSAQKNCLADPSSDAAIRARYLEDKIDAIELAANRCGEGLMFYIIRNVAEGISYDKLNAYGRVPCGRRQFYEARRRYFWLLDQILMGNANAHIS